jgi:sialic acid synthase SpsE
MPIELIAEVATGHGGNLRLAQEFIQRFAAAGADWIKFQYTRVAHLRPDDPQYAWFQQAEFSLGQFVQLRDICVSAGVKMLTTVYHPADVPEVQALGLEALKIGSGEIRELDLARAVAGKWPRVFVGTGIAPLNLSPFRKLPEVWALRSITRYPAPLLASVIKAGQSYEDRYRGRGWSDHCIGLEACYAAILAGATVIEKHVQIPGQARPCQPFEATVEEFQQLRAFADDDAREKYYGRWQYA